MPTDTDNCNYDVIVIGAGVAGASIVHHLLQEGLYCPTNTQGDNDGAPIRSILVVDAGPAPGEGCDDRKSGSATMNHQPISIIKMMTQVFACNSSEFIKHHGMEGARRYLQATKEGLALQKSIAKSLTSSNDQPNILNELGSYYVCPADQREELKAEYEFFQSLGKCCEGLEFLEDITSVPGASPDFPCAIYFPQDAVIDSAEYSKRILVAAVATGKVTLRCNSRVTRIVTHPTDTTNGEQPSRASVIVEGPSGKETFSARHGVVVATGGVDTFPEWLHGIVQPCYSYLAHVPIDNNPVQESANFFTWGFSHDWCFTQGHVRVSGEDHFSAFKAPCVEERCGRMIDWTRERYQCTPLELGSPVRTSIPQQHGIYSETSDHAPVVGTLHDGSPICFVMGCNAWGQAVLSYCASLVPGVLGFCKQENGTTGKNCLSESQRDALRLFTIRRFSELPQLRKK